MQLGKTGENDENGQFGCKFREHLGQWRLNKRGVEGETIVHLLLNREEPMCSEIARILITRYPGLANDIYLGDEMFGMLAPSFPFIPFNIIFVCAAGQFLVYT